MAESVRDINQIANYALAGWAENIVISYAQPVQYWGNNAERLSEEKLATMMQWHALPEHWWTMSYAQFLAARRPHIAGAIRRGYLKLAGVTA